MNNTLKYVFLDVETTGTDPTLHGLTQVSAIFATETGGFLSEIDSFNSLLRPFDTDVIDPKALAVQNRKAEDLQAYPDPVEVCRAFRTWLGSHMDKFRREDKAFLVGYNVRFDEDFLRAWFNRVGDKYFGSWFYWPPIDVAALAAAQLRFERKRMENFKLGTLLKVYAVTVDGSLHDAMTDIRTTLELYAHLTEVLYVRRPEGPGPSVPGDSPSDGQDRPDSKEPEEPTAGIRLPGD